MSVQTTVMLYYSNNISDGPIPQRGLSLVSVTQTKTLLNWNMGSFTMYYVDEKFNLQIRSNRFRPVSIIRIAYYTNLVSCR